MKFPFSCRFSLIVFLILCIGCTFPVSGIAAPETTPASPITAAVAPETANPMVSATVSAAVLTVGDPVTISGTATGGKPVSEVRIWVFAGSYVNVSTVMVNPDGTYSRTYQTAGLPPATYYVWVQSPGNSGNFEIDLQNSGNYSGQVVNVKSGALLVNFTGAGSVQNAEAAVALSEALIQARSDDVYTKTTFQLIAPGPATAVPATPAAPAAPAVPVQPAATKSPLSPLRVIAGLGVFGAGAILCHRK